jgi:hypothetical protein
MCALLYDFIHKGRALTGTQWVNRSTTFQKSVLFLEAKLEPITMNILQV